MTAGPWDVFVTALGQRDNAGDTALRRAYITALREAGRLHVFVGDRPATFTDNLGLRPDDVLYRDSASWRRGVTQHLRRGRTLYAYSAGEIEVDRRHGSNYLRTWLPLRLGRVRGNRTVHTGVGVREDDSARRLMSLVLRRSDVVTWRDAWSAELMGIGGVQPDWAFREGSVGADPLASEAGSPPPPERDVVAVALRWDRPLPPTELLDQLRLGVEARGQRIVCVAQTERDGARATELAALLDGEAVTWTGADHAVNEAAVRAVYRRSVVAVSDRLHGLVFAMTEGAAPVVLGDDAAGKAVRTLSVVHPDLVRLPLTAPEPGVADDALQRAADQAGTVRSAVIAARRDLEGVVGRIRRLVET